MTTNQAPKTTAGTQNAMTPFQANGPLLAKKTTAPPRNRNAVQKL